MGIFNFSEMHSFGKVQSVDTSVVVIKVDDVTQLSKLQVNHLVVIRASKTGQALIGIVSKIMRKYGDETDLAEGEEISSSDIVKLNLIGTLLDRDGEKHNVFKRTLESVPEIDSESFIMADETLTGFMSAISGADSGIENPLCIGRYTINDGAKAWLDGNKLFQRHAVIVGSTGSGKSYTVATLIEKIAELKSCNAILFDIHGEYTPIIGEGIRHYKVAGPSDTPAENIMFLPYWLLSYEEMLALMLDRSDSNAPNQAMVFSQTVMQIKEKLLLESGNAEMAGYITLDSPVPYKIGDVLAILNEKNVEMVPGAGNRERQGDFHGKLSRFIQRLEAKTNDKRLNFMFSNKQELLAYDYMNSLCKKLMAPASQTGGVKIIDFSEVPSDILPLIVSLLARVVFSVQQWIDKANLNPVAIFCDEAHLYIPANAQQGVETSSLQSFERIAKEGRKYGVGLVVISQRPSEVNRTVLSQSSNYIAMRLTNADDQNVIRKLLPDSIGNFADLLPVLDVGEAIAVGDACLLPSRIIIDRPNKEPDSATVKFWTEWSKENAFDNIDTAVEAMRKQSK
ncbi:MAG: ATP-binding protein [Ruminococcaceae bacterium]|nr:ATP-binding protein [Oscillospiraceae bacterium]